MLNVGNSCHSDCRLLPFWYIILTILLLINYRKCNASYSNCILLINRLYNNTQSMTVDKCS